MRMSEGAQELLELLWSAVEEEGHDGLEIAGALPDGADELVERGLVERRGDRLLLTEQGRPEAAGAARRHRLAERLLVDVLATEESGFEEHACRFEHVLEDGVEENICTILGHPRFCPHGKPIPPGDCCRRMQETVERFIAPLSDLQPDQGGRIAYIQMNNPRRLQKLMAMGVLPGVPIALLRRSPTFVVQVGYNQFAFDREIAADIYVRLAGVDEAPRPQRSWKRTGDPGIVR